MLPSSRRSGDSVVFSASLASHRLHEHFFEYSALVGKDALMFLLSYSRQLLWIGLCLVLSLESGCTKVLTQQAVDRFSKSLESKDQTGLKLAVSDNFEHRALRREEAIRDLQIINIPTGKNKIIEIEEVSKDEVRAKVEIGKNKAAREVIYTLTRDPKIQRWVVDDVTLKQDTGRGEATRSVIDQLDLVMSVREFVDAWHSQEPEKILSVAAPELREQLEPLPTAWLTQLAGHVAQQTPQQKSLRPDARLKDDSAFVQVGTVTVQFQLVDGHWYVRDAALKDDENTVRSALKLATALRQSQEFLNAYAEGDKERLSKVATPAFHDTCLVSADLSQAPVPGKELFEKPYEARQQKDSMDLILKSSTGAVVLSLDVQSKTGSGTPEKSALPRISEVTLAEDGTREAKRLSSVFLHEAVVNLYSEALVARDIPRLQSMSTIEFRERVWNRVRPDVMKALPLPEIEAAEPEIFHVTYAGAKTEVTVTQGTRALTYVLRSQPGRMEIEDVLIPVENRPSSLKLTVENLIPVYEFIAGVESNSIQRVSHSSSESFNAMIWSQLSEVPDLGFDPIELLTLPLTGMKIDDKLARLQFGNAKLGAEVQISRDEGETRIHDMTLITGVGQNNRHELLATMRRMISSGLSSDGKIMQAKAETMSEVPATKSTSLPRIQQSIELQ